MGHLFFLVKPRRNQLRLLAQDPGRAALQAGASCPGVEHRGEDMSYPGGLVQEIALRRDSWLPEACAWRPFSSQAGRRV